MKILVSMYFYSNHPRSRAIWILLENWCSGGTFQQVLHSLQNNVTLFENDPMGCYGFRCRGGYDGGYLLFAWRYFISNGVVTAEYDPYFDEDGCQHLICKLLYLIPQYVKQCKDENQDWGNSKCCSPTNSSYMRIAHSQPANYQSMHLVPTLFAPTFFLQHIMDYLLVSILCF